jgi:hypothetical protein
MTRAIVLVLAIAGLARAEPHRIDDAKTAEAIAHFRQGEEYFKSAQWEAAIKEYRAAYELTGEPLMIFDIALANEKAGNAEPAYDGYEHYLREVSLGGAADEARAGKARLQRTVDRIRSERAELQRVEAAAAADAAKREAERREIAHARAEVAARVHDDRARTYMFGALAGRCGRDRDRRRRQVRARRARRRERRQRSHRRVDRRAHRARSRRPRRELEDDRAHRPRSRDDRDRRRAVLVCQARARPRRTDPGRRHAERDLAGGPVVTRALLALAAGCYAPQLTEGLPCSETAHCPEGQTCDPDTNTCVSHVVHCAQWGDFAGATRLANLSVPGHDLLTPWLSPDKLELWYVDNAATPHLWRSRREPGGDFPAGEPVAQPDDINSDNGQPSSATIC